MSRANCFRFYAFDAYSRRRWARGTFFFFVVISLCLFWGAVCVAQDETLERFQKNRAFSFRELASEGVANVEGYVDGLEGRFFFLEFLKTTPAASVLQAEPTFGTSVDSRYVPSLASDLAIYRAASVSDFTIKPYRGRLSGRINGAWGSQEGQGDDADTGGFEVKSWGGGIGQDWTLTSNLIWGYGLQANKINITPERKTSYEADYDVLAGYLQLGVFAQLWRFDVAIGASKNWQTQRLLSTSEKRKITSSQRNYEAEFGARFDRGYTRIEPRVNFRVISLSEPRSAESFLTSYFFMPNEFSDASYRLRIGSRFSWEYETFLATFKPYLSADWGHEFGNKAIYTIGDSSRYPVAYRFGKHKTARDRLDLGGGLDVALHHCCDVYARYDVEFAKEYVDYLGNAGVNIKF